MLTVPGVTGGIITLLVILGLLLGLGAGHIEFLHPSQTALDAAERQYQLDHAKQVGAVEEWEARQHAQRRLAFEDRLLAVIETVAEPAIGAVVVGLLLVAIGITVFLVCCGLARLRSNGPPPPPTEGQPQVMAQRQGAPAASGVTRPPGGSPSVVQPTSPPPPQTVATASANGRRP